MEGSTDIKNIKVIIESIIAKENKEDLKDSLELFVEKASHLYKFDVLNNYGLIPNLWTKLFKCMSNQDLEIQLLCLDALRILTRNSSLVVSVLTAERMNILLQYANILNDNAKVDTDYRTVAALKCLYNIIYNSREGLNIIIRQNCIDRILNRAENGDSKLMSQIKLFDMKVLFLVSALCKDVREKMKEKHGIKHLIKKLEYVQDATTSTLSTPEVDVFCEILKILFNLSLEITDDDEDQESCLRLVELLRRLLVVEVFNDKVKMELHSNVVNLLTNMTFNSYKALIVEIKQKDRIQDLYKYDGYNCQAISRLLEFLQIRLVESNEKQELLAPILTALLRTASSVRVIRKYLRSKILPPLRDVHKRPEEGNTLRNRLCRLLTSPANNLSDLAASLLFTLCKENVARMIKHTGYGNAAGLLARRGLLTGCNSSSAAYSSDSEDSDTEEYRRCKDGINPVVGCVEPPHPNVVSDMTQEQKEHEVMQLVNLMDDLNRKGVFKPCKIGQDGKLQPVEHILELQNSLPTQQIQSKKKE